MQGNCLTIRSGLSALMVCLEDFEATKPPDEQQAQKLQKKSKRTGQSRKPNRQLMAVLRWSRQIS